MGLPGLAGSSEIINIQTIDDNNQINKIAESSQENYVMNLDVSDVLLSVLE